MERLDALNTDADNLFFNEQYMRPDGDYLVVTQPRKGLAHKLDLYTYVRNRGALSEYDIGSIARRLLYTLSDLKERKIVLSLLTPSNILVKDSSMRNPTIDSVSIVNVAPMAMA